MFEIYQNKIAKKTLKQDAAQFQAIEVLDAFAEQLVAYLQSGFRLLRKRNQLPQSVYLYGNVGRGKTMLMDMLYTHISVKKQRWHFSAFMGWLHKEMHSLRDTKNPITHITTKFAKQTDLLCLDELQVTDITDAMLLSEFFHTLLDAGVVMCVTSNTHPSELYTDGLQRQRFLPVVQRIIRDFAVVPLVDGYDYRLSHSADTRLLKIPATALAKRQILQVFSQLQSSPPQYNTRIVAGDRQVDAIAVYRQANAVVFTFASLCNVPLHTKNYAYLAKHWPTIGILDIPVFDDNSLDQLRRFVYLIDQLYEFQCALACSATSSIHMLYQGEKLQIMYQRAASRVHSLLNNTLTGNRLTREQQTDKTPS